MSDLLRYNDSQKYLLFDYETENLCLLTQNRPWNLAFIIAQGNQVLEEHDYYPFWPDLNVGKDAASKTHFNYNEYKKKSRSNVEILDIFESFLYNPDFFIVGHNLLGFDIYIHNIYRKELNRKTDYSYIPRIIDTKSLSAAYKLGIKYEKGTDWMFRLNYLRERGVKTSLQTMAKEFKIPFDPDKMHAGLEDIRVNFQVFNKLKWLIEI